MSSGNEFPLSLEAMLATLARIFASKAATLHVAILADAEGGIELTEFDNWDGGIWRWALYLKVTPYLYAQIIDMKDNLTSDIYLVGTSLLSAYPRDELIAVHIVPALSTEDGWREKAKAWLTGEGVSNQGRVRSDNIASKVCDGLLFRSEQEILLYKALKAKGITFAPLPVFVRGGETYRRIEPDFVIIKDGMMVIVEVDGDTVHQETPAEAYDRTTMLENEGAEVVRVKASECATNEQAKVCADKIIRTIDKLKISR